MYILFDGSTKHVFDWITPIQNITTITEFLGNEQAPITLCLVQNEDTIDIWKTNANYDYRYDLQRYYHFVYRFDFDKMEKVFIELNNFTLT